MISDKQMDSIGSSTVPPSQPEERPTDTSDADVPDINEQMISVPSVRNSRPRRIEVSTDQTSGALEHLEMNHSIVLEAATSVSTGAHETLLFYSTPPFEEVYYTLILIISQILEKLRNYYLFITVESFCYRFSIKFQLEINIICILKCLSMIFHRYRQ